MNQIDRPIISFFGSHLVKRNDTYFEHAQKMGKVIGKNEHAILTGGGTGIMEAANTGATQASAPSIGFRAELLKWQHITKPIYTHTASFHFLFVRKFFMSIKSEALLFYPGGMGTLDELFEYATLMQTNITDKVPIICVGKKYWEGLFKWMKKVVVQNDFLLRHSNLDFIQVTDSQKDILKIINR